MICLPCAQAADGGQIRHPCADLISCTCQHGGNPVLVVDTSVPEGYYYLLPHGPARKLWEHAHAQLGKEGTP